MALFPSVLSIFNQTNPTDLLSSPSHSALHDTVSSAVGQIEAVVGVDGANSILGTVMSDLRNPDSGGGGHVQTANKGGTGQTAYTKGDILVATSASVLSKLAIGVDGQAVVADSSVASGVKWGTAGNKVTVVSSVVSLRSPSSVETTLFSVNVVGSTLGTSGAIRFKSYIDFVTLGASSTMATIKYGGGPIASVFIAPPSARDSVAGVLEGVLMATGSATAQRATMFLQAATIFPDLVGVSSVWTGIVSRTSSVESSADQTLAVTLTPINSPTANTSFDVEGTVVEKIV